MQIIKWEPLEGIDRLFDDRNFSLLSLFTIPGFDLAVDLYEEKGNLVAKMNVSGMQSKDIDISFKDDILSISGKREDEKEVDKKDYYSKEIRRGSFVRSVRLPKSIDATKIEASFKNGELMIVMPIVQSTKDASIKIKVT